MSPSLSPLTTVYSVSAAGGCGGGGITTCGCVTGVCATGATLEPLVAVMPMPGVVNAGAGPVSGGGVGAVEVSAVEASLEAWSLRRQPPLTSTPPTSRMLQLRMASMAYFTRARFLLRWSRSVPWGMNGLGLFMSLMAPHSVLSFEVWFWL